MGISPEAFCFDTIGGMRTMGKGSRMAIDASVRGRVQLAVFEAAELVCRPRNEALWREVERLAEAYRRRFAEPSAARELLRPARELYRRIGIEPTKVRPSSEALLRRAIQGKPLYPINSIVDACNYCSLSFLLPIGLYDRRKIQGKIQARLGREGESYAGIRKETVHVEHRLTLADDEGAFGNPSADSMRTAISEQTTHILWVIFAPYEYPRERFQAHLDFSIEQVLRYHPGRLLAQEIIC